MLVDELVALAENFREPMAVAIRMSTKTHSWFREQFIDTGSGTSPFTYYSPLLHGIAVYVDDEIPDGTMAVMDQYDMPMKVILVPTLLVETSWWLKGLTQHKCIGLSQA